MLNPYLNQYKRILAIAQAGLFYGKDAFDQERYQELKCIALDLLTTISEEPFSKLERLADQEEGYPTPKIDVRAFIQQKDGILLVQDTKTKTWSLPGGYAEVGLSPTENIKKEVHEETGLNVEVGNLLAVFDTNLRMDIPQLFQYYKLVFSCKSVSGSFKNNLETSAIGFFKLDQLPPLSKNRTTSEQLRILDNLTEPYIE